ncbi:HAD family hydrolase [Paenibacillus sp. 453mf]|uniref:HAD family hydrolase n=1 Tax=Paenibacillus sp. 453mf TaxID=1761874 RepID=UPI0008F22301|nr:HAD family hydrolase [Paenibacillus sp. 453mf]SFS79113.1 putative hydrolase of the HAD superfamily [Paenibacillus sp. 453mf]
MEHSSTRAGTNAASTAVFFDVDDTLYDHLAPLREALMQRLHLPGTLPYEAIYHRFRYYSDLLSAEKNLSAVPAPEEVADMRRRRFMLALAEFGIFINEEQAEAAQAAYLDMQFRIKPFPGMVEMIQHLRDRGVIVGLITNGPEEHQMAKIKALQMESYMDQKLFFVSGGVGYAKPDAQLFQYVNKVTGTAPENCYYVGDSWRNDVVGALAAGWTVLWFNHRRAEPESEHKPHSIAENVEQLEAILMKLMV